MDIVAPRLCLGLPGSDLYRTSLSTPRIGKNQVFIRQNVQYMRYLGWEVGMVTLISFFMGLTVYMPMLLVAVSCCILTLIIRVIRNAFGKAIELQEEVDYTI